MIERRGLSRRDFLKGAGVASIAVLPTTRRGRMSAPYLSNSKLSKKVIVLGMDGLDPSLVRRFVAEGSMPTFKMMMERGHFGELQTTMPPQSPVAWSSFISGCNPGGTGIFDFVHRDPKSFSPYLSTSRTFGSGSSFKVGNWQIPLSGGRMENMRRGPAFWSVLEAHGIPTTVYQIPANFPVIDESRGGLRAMSGMGTPDLLGSYGTFTLFSELAVSGAEEWDGGVLERLQVIDHQAKTVLRGPKNSLRSDGSDSQIDITINRDPHDEALKIAIQDHQIMLRQGEWSEWVPLSFELMPMFAHVGGMVRFFAKQVHPYIKIYASPINVDPMDPSVPICTPTGYSRELSQAIGRFYTQGFPSDTKALSMDALSDDEYLGQAKIVFAESLKSFEYQFDRFQEGCFFFYFSSTDQNQHMLWRCMDPTHPLYNPNASPDVKGAVKWFYQQMDLVLKKALTKVDNDTTLIALSDHGFAPFSREVNLTTWLAREGFTSVDGPLGNSGPDFFRNVDWRKTKAYTIGLNGIYINLEGREKNGSVKAHDVAQIKADIIAKLTPLTDPKTGQRAITQVYDGSKLYSGPFTELAPDLVVGYQRGYRISDRSAFGKFPGEIFGDRTDKWSADHCLDPVVVPGMWLSNRQCAAVKPGLWDMAPTIIDAFGLPVPREMEGKPALV